jgi:tetratricopeptide (TPR) repeat protein
MGCISCHDPHELPPAGQRVDYYRQRCLDCHQEKSCALSPGLRQQQQKDDSCTACHMPRFQSFDIAHTAVTNHRILRRQEIAPPGSRQPAKARPGGIPIVNFFAKDSAPQDASSSRDLGLALIYLGDKTTRGRESIALTLLEKAVEDCPNDAAAWEAKGSALVLQRRMTAALAALETALAKAPERETALAQAVLLAEAMGQPDKSVAYLRRLIAVNPWIAEYHYKLSELLSRRGAWRNALDECEAAMRLNPNHDPTRILFITCCLRCGKQDLARSEMQTLVALNPKEEMALRSWFARLMP